MKFRRCLASLAATALLTTAAVVPASAATIDEVRSDNDIVQPTLFPTCWFGVGICPKK